MKCPRCNLLCKCQSALIVHLSRKKPCKPTFDNTDCKTLIEQIQNEQPEKKYLCHVCGGRFLNRKSKYVHQKSCKKESANEDDEITRLKNRIAELEEFVKGGNIINNNNTINQINQHINIQVLPPRDFARDENTSFLESNFLLECFRDMEMIRLLEEISCNPDHSENHNVRIKNLKQNLIEYIENGKWKVGKKDDILHHFVFVGHRVLRQYHKNNKDDIEDEMTSDEIDESLEWLRSIYNEDKVTMKELKDNALLLLINNKTLLVNHLKDAQLEHQ